MAIDVGNIIIFFGDLLSEDMDDFLFVLAILIFFYIDLSNKKKKKQRRTSEPEEQDKDGQEELRMDGDERRAADDNLEGDQTIVIPDLFRTLPPEETQQHQTILRDTDWRARQKHTDGKIYTTPQDASADGVTTDDEALAKNRSRTVYDVTTDDEAIASDRHTHTDGMIHSNRRLHTEAALLPEKETDARLKKRANLSAQEKLPDAAPVFSDDELVNAVIMSEILGKPKALQ